MRSYRLRDLIQSTRGLKNKIPPSEAIAYAISYKALGGLKNKIPPSEAIAYAISYKALGGLKNKIPPSEAIAYAISYKALGGLRIKSPRALGSSQPPQDSGQSNRHPSARNQNSSELTKEISKVFSSLRLTIQLKRS